MSTLNSLDKEMFHYLPRLSSRQKETVLTVVKTFAEEAETFTLEEVEVEARQSYKKRKNKK